MNVSFNRFRTVWIMVMIAAGTIDCVAASAERIARRIRIENVEFREASLQQAVDYLNKKAQEQLGDGEKLRIYCTEQSPKRLRFHLPKRPLYDSLEEISRQTGLPLFATEGTLHFGAALEPLRVRAEGRVREEGDIRETVFRFLFEYNEVDSTKDVSAYFIRVDGADPEDKFVERFAGYPLPVKKASVASKTEERTGRFFSVGALRWLDDTKVEILGIYPEGNWVYEVMRTTKGWRIIKEMPGAVVDHTRPLSVPVAVLN